MRLRRDAVSLLPIELVDADVRWWAPGSLARLARADAARPARGDGGGARPPSAIRYRQIIRPWPTCFSKAGDRCDLPRIRPFSKWDMAARRPDVAGGVKRGFTFATSVSGCRRHEHGNQLPRGQPRDEVIRHISTRRISIRRSLVAKPPSRASRRHASRAHARRGRSRGARGDEQPIRRISARFVVDASGRGFIARWASDPPLAGCRKPGLCATSGMLRVGID